MQPLTNNHGIIVATIIPQNKMVWTASDNTSMATINDNFYWYSLPYISQIHVWKTKYPISSYLDL